MEFDASTKRIKANHKLQIASQQHLRVKDNSNPSFAWTCATRLPKMLQALSNFLFQASPKGHNLPLAGPAIYVILVDVAYIAFVFKIGPRLMQKREPLELKTALIVYNGIQILWNCYMACRSTMGFFELDLELGCIRQLPDNHSHRHMEIWLYYIYYINKYLDYADTIFFVLRKSNRQITFLHVYHHVLMTSALYIHIRVRSYGGHVTLIGILNSYVHTVMYTYYLLSVLSPAFRGNSKGWKRRLTEMQILQFVMILFHQMWPLFVRVDCEYPLGWAIAGISQAIFMIYLFGKFYQKTYLSGGGGGGATQQHNDMEKLKSR